MDLNSIKIATRHLHSMAEQTGFIADILAGKATRYGLALLLRNLLPVYQILDSSKFGGRFLARVDAIEADLRLLSPGIELDLLPAGAAYAARLRSVVGEGDAGLIAHAYVRYLGDLNGGQTIHQRLLRSLGPVATQLGFHRFSSVGDYRAFAERYRDVLDRALRAAEFDTVAWEVERAFQLNITLSEAIHHCAPVESK